jgi:hypothetical protein
VKNQGEHASGIFNKLRVGEAWRRVAHDASVRAALFTFALTRIIVLGILILTAHVNLHPPDINQGTRDFYLLLDKVRVARDLRGTLHVADINWYLSISQNGYERRPFDATTEHNWAFFPLFPLLLRVASALTGEYLLTGMALSSILFFCALVLLHKTVIAFGLDSADADRSIFYLAAFPTSYFFSLPLTESLFLFLTVASFYAARRRAWWTASLVGALASGTRATGVLLLPTLAVLYWLTYRPDWRRPQMLSLLLIPTGLVAFMAYLYAITGNPFAFKDVLVVWGRSTGFFLWPFYHYLANPLRVAVPWSFHLLNVGAGGVGLVCGIVLLRRRMWSLAIYTLASVFVTLSSNLIQSQARYVMVLFPVFMILAIAGRRRRVDEIIRAFSLVLLSLMTLLFAAHFSIAMS